MFYEINLSDCDHSNATIHVFVDGRIDYNGSSYSKVKRLAKLTKPSESDADMPNWVKKYIIKLEK